MLGAIASIMLHGTREIEIEPNHDFPPNPEQRTRILPKPTPVPKGCLRYWFDAVDNMSITVMPNSKVAYKCIASSEKRAIKKYKKWKKTQ